MLRRLALSATVLGIAAVAFATIFPIANSFLRLLALLGGAATVVGLVILVWPKPGLRWLTLVLFGAVALFLSWPGHPVDSEFLRKSYLSSLESYDGLAYVWGGENSLGIDCSGLVRRAMIDALVTTGLRTANPLALRLALRLWWKDQTARTFAEGLHTVVIQSTPSPLSAQTDLNPGDLAVSADGIHILACLGDDRWIDADPTAQNVRILPAAENPWLSEPVRIVRWQWLE